MANMSKKRRKAYKELNKFFRRIGEGKRVTHFPRSLRKAFR